MDKRGLFHENSEAGDSDRSLVTVGRGWVYIYGVVLSSYCYVFLFIMSFFFLLSGVLFTAISYRPQQIGEQFGEWSYRLAKSRKTRIAGPAFILLGGTMVASSTFLCILSRRFTSAKRTSSSVVYQNEVADEGLDEPYSVVQHKEKSYFHNGYSDMSSLIVSDIACFPETPNMANRPKPSPEQVDV